MSSIRVFLLDALSRGEAHGHQLHAEAAEEYIELWTDIQVGGLTVPFNLDPPTRLSSEAGRDSENALGAGRMRFL